MNNFRAEADQKIARFRTGSSLYVTTDGALRFCVTAPLLELPLDFKAWYSADGNALANFAVSGEDAWAMVETITAN